MHYRFVRALLLLLTVLLFFRDVRAQSTDQNYPVTAQAFIVAQPNQRLSSYFSSSTALSVNLLLKDLTKNSIQVYLRWSMEGTGVRVSSMDGYIPANLITLDRGMIRRFSGLDLQHDYFRQDLIEEQGLGNSPLRTNLPEGFYTFRVQALEAGTGREVSNIGETYFSITTPLPPIINIPFNGAELTTAGVPMTEPQRVNIQWMPRHYRMPGNITTYDLKVCKVPDGYEPTEALDACVNPVIDDKGNPGTFYPGNTGIGNSLIGALERGARYAARVTVHEFDTDGNEVVFVNEGRSEVNWFRYGKECVSPESFVITETGPGRLQLNWEAAADVDSYKVLYRKTGDTKWTTQIVSATTASITDLALGSYEFAIQSGCTDIVPDHVQTFEVTDESDDLEDLPIVLADPMQIPVQVSGCTAVTPGELADYYSNFPGTDGTVPSDTTGKLKLPGCTLQSSAFSICSPEHPMVPLPTGGTELANLKTGDVLGIYDFAVFITEVSGSESFSGKGLVRLPFMEGTLALAEFSGVKAIRSDDGNGGCVYEATNFRLLNVPQSEVAAAKSKLLSTLAQQTDPAAYAGTLAGALAGYETISDTASLFCTYTAAILQASEEIRKALVDAGGVPSGGDPSEGGNPDPRITDILTDLKTITDQLMAGSPKVDSITQKYQDLISKLDALKKDSPSGEPGSGPGNPVFAIRNVQVSGIDNKSARINWELSGGPTLGGVPSGGTASKYIIEYQDKDGAVLQETVKSPVIDLSRLREGMEYKYRILAYDGDKVIATYGQDVFQTIKRRIGNPQNLQYAPKTDDSKVVRITWDANKDHRSYKLVYVDQNGIENTVYPTTNQVDIGGLDRNRSYPYRIMAYGDDGVFSEEVSGQFNVGTVCEISLVASSLRVMPGTPVTLTVYGCADEFNKPGVVEWLDGSNATIGRTEDITVTPQATTTYKVVCLLDKLLENGQKEHAGCSKQETVIVDKKCEGIVVTATPVLVKYGDPVLLRSNGCFGETEWRDGYPSGQIVSSHSAAIVFPKITTEYNLTCTEADGDVCVAKSDKVNVSCDNFILTWSAISTTKGYISVRASGCDGDITWSETGKDGKIKKEYSPDKHSVFYSDVDQGFSVQATCTASGCQYDTGFMGRPGKKAGCFMAVELLKETSKTFTLKVSTGDNIGFRWLDNNSSKNPREFPIPDAPKIYTAYFKGNDSYGNDTHCSYQYLYTPKKIYNTLSPIPCLPFGISVPGTVAIPVNATSATASLSASGCSNGVENFPVIWKKEGVAVNSGKEGVTILTFNAATDKDKTFNISATCSLTGEIKTGKIKVTQLVPEPLNPIDPCNIFVYTNKAYNYFPLNTLIEFTILGGNSISFLPKGKTPKPLFLRTEKSGERVYSIAPQAFEGTYSFEVQNTTTEGALCTVAFSILVLKDKPIDYVEGNFQPNTPSTAHPKQSGDCGSYYQFGTNSAQFGIPRNPFGYSIATVYNNGSKNLGVFAIYDVEPVEYEYDPENIGLVDKVCSENKGSFSLYSDARRDVNTKVGGSGTLGNRKNKMDYISVRLNNKVTKTYYGRCTFGDQTYCDTEITIVPGLRGNGRIAGTEEDQNEQGTEICQYSKREATNVLLQNLICETLSVLKGNEKQKLEAVKAALSTKGIMLADITEAMVSNLAAGKCSDVVNALTVNITGNELVQSLNDKLVNKQMVDQLVNDVLNVILVEPVVLVATVTDATCKLDDGVINLKATGGVPPYQFSMDGTTFQESLSFTKLESGNYTLTVKDSKNATATATAIVKEPETYLIETSSFAIPLRLGNTDPNARITDEGYVTAQFDENSRKATFKLKAGFDLKQLSSGVWKLTITSSDQADKKYEGTYRPYFNACNHSLFVGFYKEDYSGIPCKTDKRIDLQGKQYCIEGWLPESAYAEIVKNIMIFANGYRFYGKGTAGILLNSPKEYNNSNNIITTSSIADYWGADPVTDENKSSMDIKFSERRKPDVTYYADGHHSITTSNHNVAGDVTRSMSEKFIPGILGSLLAQQNMLVSPFLEQLSYLVGHFASIGEVLTPLEENALSKALLSFNETHPHINCSENPDCVALDTQPNDAGFQIRYENGKLAATDLIARMISIKRPANAKVTYNIDIVAHSMGFAYAQGMIAALANSSLKDKITWSSYYIIAPENGCSETYGKVDPVQWKDQLWQYGSNRGQGQPDPVWDQDGVAPQCEVGNIGFARRAFIPATYGNGEKIPKGYLDSHSISNYGWIFEIPNEKDAKGYVQSR